MLEVIYLEKLDELKEKQNALEPVTINEAINDVLDYYITELNDENSKAQLQEFKESKERHETTVSKFSNFVKAVSDDTRRMKYSIITDDVYPTESGLYYSTEGSAALDLRSTEDVLFFESGEVKCVPTGIVVEIPDNMCGLVLTRSSYALKHDIVVNNAPGLIDSDYRGEVCVILKNQSSEVVCIYKGDRIAQLLIQNYVQVKPQSVPLESITQTDRGEGGFGSTGNK